ncbi:MAG: dTMP kinase [Candidatus Neomarinimicrobiota bacterium]
MSISNKRFITFEGIDGCGKTTQARLLNDHLVKAGHEVTFVREPGGTAISEAIRHILLDNNRKELGERTEALLMTASRAQLTRELILPELGAGHWVIADRYADSTLAYQGAGRTIDLEWLIELNRFATFELEPTVTFVFDVDPEIGLQRRKNINDRIEDEGLEFQRKVRRGYLNIAERFSSRIIVLDGHAPIAQLQDQVQSELLRRALL